MKNLNLYLIALILILLAFLIKTCNEKTNAELNVIQRDSKINIFKDALGRNISVMQSKIVIQSDLIGYLKDHKITKIVNPSTIISHTDSIHDTVIAKVIEIKGCSDTMVYKAKFADKWAKIDISGTKDSCKVNYTINNEQSVIIGFKRKWLLGTKIPFVQIVNENPHITTTSIKSLTLQPERGKIPKIATLVGAGMLSGFFLAKIL
jgi:hypothetical protein